MIEKHYSLRDAAKQIGVDPRCLKRWLRQDLGIVIPRVRRGSKVMIRERDIERILAKRRTAQGAAA